MTALGRVLIEIGGAEHKTGKDLLIVAGAILVLSLAVLVLRFASHKDDPSDSSVTEPRGKYPRQSRGFVGTGAAQSGRWCR